MINTLHIKNIGIIDELSIDLNCGFNVLTGETGAGKTLIIDSLGILAGERFSKDMIRNNETYSFVEMNISSEDRSKEDIIVSREININGKNMCKINGRMVTVSELKEFMSTIIDIHGQHDNQSLLDVTKHIKYLDDFAGNEILNLKNQYSIVYNQYINLKNEIAKNYGDEKEKQRKLDLLRYQLNEIEEAQLKENEEEQLEEKRKIMQNYEKISENLNQADMQLSMTSIDSVNSAIKNLEKIDSFDDKYSSLLNSLKNAYYDLQEVAIEVSKCKDDIYFDEEERNEIELRLDTIYSLKRKYGNNITEILKYKEDIQKEIYEIENLEEYTNKLKKDLTLLEEKMLDLSRKMHGIRKNNSEIISRKIDNELKDLEMKQAKFKVEIEYEENSKYNINGLDKIEFMISTNIEEDYKPLAKIASGGEMSRIMLAIKTVLADVDNIPVLVFDEIDTGISGVAAKKVAEKIKVISKKHQVICITHLASIAAKGDWNYYISKNTKDGRTKTHIELLNEENTIKEIARIASGEITEISIKHACELRNSKMKVA